MSTPGKPIPRRTFWWWPAFCASLAAGVVWLCARPGGCQIGSRVVTVSLKALGEMGPDAVPALLEILQMNSSPARRSYAANALGRIGPAALSAAPRLREWLGADVHSGMRASAALALWKMGDRDDAIIQTLMDCLSDEAGGLRAVRALAEIGPPAKVAIPALETARSDRTTSVRQEINSALARIKAPTAEGNAR